MAAPCGKLPGASFEGFRVAAGSCGTSSNFVLWDLNEGNCRRKNFGNCCLAVDPGWVVVSNMFYFQPYLGKIPILTNIFQMG